jgi:hypothetical protein
MENENDKRKARRRRRNSKAPDPFRRAHETDSSLRKSVAGEAPSSRRGSSADGAPPSRNGSAALRSHEVTDAGAARALADSMDIDSAPASERRSAKTSERRPKLVGAESAAVITEVSEAPSTEAPRSRIEAPPPADDRAKAKRIAVIIAVTGVVATLLLWWVTRGPATENAAGPASGQSPAGPVEMAPPTPPAVPSAIVEAPAPAPSAAATEAQPSQEATDEEQSAADKKKKKKKKTGAKVEATAKPAPPTTSAAPAPTPPPPAFQFQFD